MKAADKFALVGVVITVVMISTSDTNWQLGVSAALSTLLAAAALLLLRTEK